jgi:hypothetical protein
MLRTIGSIVALVLVLATAWPAQAQTGERVLDTLGDLLRGNQQIQGYVVAVHDADIVVRGRDNRTYTISTSDIDRQQLSRLHPGKPVKISLKRGSDQALVATAIEPQSGEQRSFRTASGVVEQVNGDRVQVRTNDGAVVTADLNQIVGQRPALRVGDRATVTYEQSGANAQTVVWIETQSTFGAASPGSPEPATGGGYERIHGFVDAVGVGSLTLKTDDGRTLNVDVSRSRGGVGDVRPGDLVNVTGRASGADRFVAEIVRKD